MQFNQNTKTSRPYKRLCFICHRAIEEGYLCDEHELEKNKLLTFVDEHIDSFMVDVIHAIDYKRTGRNIMSCCPVHHGDDRNFSYNPKTMFFNCFSRCHGIGDAIKLLSLVKNELTNEQYMQLTSTMRMFIYKDAFDFLVRWSKGEYVELVPREIPKEPEVEDITFESVPSIEELLYEDFKDEYQVREFLGSLLPMSEGDGFTRFSLEECRRYDIRKKIGRIKPYLNYHFFYMIHDESGRLVGYQTRHLQKEPPIGKNGKRYPKNLNLSGLQKERLIYNLNRVINRKDYKYLVLHEGPADVIATERLEDYAALSFLGSSISNYQIALLKKYIDYFQPIIICADSDEKGMQFKEELKKKLRPHFEHLFICHLPNGKDPEDLTKEELLEHYYLSEKLPL